MRANEPSAVEDGVASTEGPSERRSVEHIRLDRLGIDVA
jgi:hypothetical protein